jgi:hypothetical protein
MSAVKVLVTIILSFLLLISLLLFGIGLLINSTLLNPDFVAGQVDKLDMNAIAHDFIEEQVADEIPQEEEFLEEAAYDVIAEQEPWLKEQMNNAIYAGYDYLLGKSEKFEINIPLDELKANIKVSLWKTLQKYLKQDASVIPEDLLVPYIVDNSRELFGRIPLLPQELTELVGKQLEDYLYQHYDRVTDILQVALKMPGLSDWLLGQIKPYFDQYYDDLVKDFPDSQVIDENEIPADVMEQLQVARRSIGYFHTGYYCLIAFMVLLVAGVILVNRNVKDSSLALGIVFLFYGIVALAGVLFARYYDFVKLIPDVPTSIGAWLPGLIRDALAPLQWFSLGILVLGATLVLMSVLYKPSGATE